MQPFEVPNSPNPISCVRSSPNAPSLIFTHGAGGTLASDGIVNFADGFSAVSAIACFKGSMNLGSRVKSFKAVAHHLDFHASFGGRSMGARAAVMAAAAVSDSDEEEDVPGTRNLVLVSYPLQGPKETRDQILLDIGTETKVLFISGEKDSMCDLDLLGDVREKMQCRSWMVTVRGADHGMNVVPKAGTGPVGRMTGRVAAEWLRDVEGLGEKETEGVIWWDAERGEAEWSGWKNKKDEEGLKAGSDDATEAKSEKKSQTVKGSGKSKTTKSSPRPKAAKSRAKNTKTTDKSDSGPTGRKSNAKTTKSRKSASKTDDDATTSNKSSPEQPKKRKHDATKHANDSPDALPANLRRSKRLKK